MCLRVFVCLPVASSFLVLCFHSVSVFLLTVYCLMDPCGLISNKDEMMMKIYLCVYRHSHVSDSDFKTLI